MAITDEKELGKALQDGIDSIEIEGNLKDKVLRIKASGKVAWVIALGAIAIAVIVALSNTLANIGETNKVLMESPDSAPHLWLGGVWILVGIAVVAIIVAMLNKFRGYKLEKVSNTRIILRKK